MAIKLNEHIVEIEGKEYIPYDIAVTIGEGERIRIKVGQKHRVQNPSFDNKLEFIEVQTGTYFGEDDIIRIEDDYGRLELDHLKDHVTMKEEQVKNKTGY